MRYRQLGPSGDYTFGSGQLNFLINSPEAVGQVVETSLQLWLGEWYLNTNAGVPYPEGVLGRMSQAEADATLIAQIGQCQGVVDVLDFVSQVDPNTRAYTVISCTINTIYGQTQVQLQDQGDF